VKNCLLLGLMLTFGSLSQAQTEDEVFVVDQPLSSIESTVISVRVFFAGTFRVFGNAKGPVHIVVNYGQPCMNPQRGISSVGNLKSCSLLLDVTGKPLAFDSYVLALDFMQRLGWELKGIISIGENVDQLTSAYIFSKL
jgi:hypothetical protein